MASRYQGLQWGTRSGDYPIVIEKFNVFKGMDGSTRAFYAGPIRIGSYRAPFIRLAVSKDTLCAITLYTDYYYTVQKQIPVMAADLFYLTDKPFPSGEVAYIQLIVNKDGSMRAKVRGVNSLDVFEYRLDTEQWHSVFIDRSKPWNW